MSKKLIGVKIVSNNRRARHDYFLMDHYEAGMVLTGTEIKSVRANQVSLRHAFVAVVSNELWLMEANIAVYKHGNRENHEPTRPRKLLLNRREIIKIMTAMAQKGLTVIPTRLYLRRGRAKIEIATARGKKNYDKRQDLAKRDSDRNIRRAMKENY